jgi:signal transduction histidine kinase
MSFVRDVNLLSLAESRASDAQRRVILVAIAATTIAALLVIPVASQRWVEAPAVAGLFATIVAIVDFLTWALLAANARVSRSRWLSVLSLAYLYDGVMALLHLLTFPGALVPGRQIIGRPDSVGWLFLCWRVGFPVLILVAVLVAARERSTLTKRNFLRGLVAAIAATLCVTVALYLFVGHADLPPYFQGNRFAGWPVTAAWLAAFLCALTLLVTWMSGKGNRLIFIGLNLALVANVIGLTIPNFGAERYTVGWYVARLAMVMSSTVVLGLLLAQVVRTQRSLAWTVSRLDQRTQSLQAEMHRRTTAERMLSQAQKMEAVGQLAGGIAHDFNNMLQVIGMRTEALRRRGGAGSAGEDSEVIQRTVRRAESLTRQLLSFAGRRRFEPQPVRLDTWLPLEASSPVCSSACSSPSSRRRKMRRVRGSA